MTPEQALSAIVQTAAGVGVSFSHDQQQVIGAAMLSEIAKQRRVEQRRLR